MVDCILHNLKAAASRVNEQDAKSRCEALRAGRRLLPTRSKQRPWSRLYRRWRSVPQSLHLRTRLDSRVDATNTTAHFCVLTSTLVRAKPPEMQHSSLLRGDQALIGLVQRIIGEEGRNSWDLPHWSSLIAISW